jgi:hypothetical protein
MAAPQTRPVNDKFLQVRMANIDAAGSVYVVAPQPGVIQEILSVIDGAFTVANVVITPAINGTNISGVTHTIPTSGSGAGVVNRTAVGGSAAVNDGDVIKLTTNAAGTGAVAAEFVIVLRT